LARQAIETGKDDLDALWMAGYSMPSLAGDKATGESAADPLGYLFTCGLAFGHTIAGEYEEALLWADRSLREMPRYRAAINLKVILYVLLGRVDEAR